MHGQLPDSVRQALCHAADLGDTESASGLLEQGATEVVDLSLLTSFHWAAMII